MGLFLLSPLRMGKNCKFKWKLYEKQMRKLECEWYVPMILDLFWGIY